MPKASFFLQVQNQDSSGSSSQDNSSNDDAQAEQSVTLLQIATPSDRAYFLCMTKSALSQHIVSVMNGLQSCLFINKTDLHFVTYAQTCSVEVRIITLAVVIPSHVRKGVLLLSCDSGCLIADQAVCCVG